MFDGFAEYRTPSVEDYQRLFSFGLVVVDTNVLLTLYRSNQRTREDLLTVLDRLRERLWVPHQVLAEFWRNREHTSFLATTALEPRRPARRWPRLGGLPVMHSTDG
ncbi:PIN-like domain-containing protein [Streptomyces luteogriseus]